MIKELYIELKAKYDLPEYDIVNNELEIYEIDSEDFVLRRIRRKLSDKVDNSLDILGSILQPNADSLMDMEECQHFTESDKKKIISLYKELMIIHRSCLEADFLNSEENEAALIKDFFSRWNSIKEGMLPFISKLKACWKMNNENEEKLRYFV